MYGSISRLRRSPWFQTAFVFAILAVVIWFFGPLIAFGSVHLFDSMIVRLIAIAVLVALWVAVNLIRIAKAKHKEAELAQTITQADKDATASAEEVALLSDRLREAMQRLRKAPGGRRERKRLHQLPWYLFIGPPGSGKTTALVNSGLNFPLADTKGPAALKGVGGTRNCDWWFTDEAVLIDTAGRYTTQDSQSAVDAGAWIGFLKLLKKHRTRQPLNGVLLAISLSDLSALSDTDRLAHATAMRKRIRELHEQLGVRVPVYVLFTKADLVAGFAEFFDNLGKEEREQVWGMSFPIDDGKEEAGVVGQFASEFDLLLARINERLLERLNQETDIQRRRLIYGFPQQLASLRATASEFLTEIFRPSRLEERPLLRGVYLTSGTQDGTPIDRLLGVMAGQFGLPRQAVSAFSGTGRSYFLMRMLREVVFGEASLVSFDKKLERRARWTYRGAYTAAAVVLLLLTAGWTNSYMGNVDMIGDAHTSADKYNAQYAELMKRGPNDTDLRVIVPPLDTLRAMRGGYDHREESTPVELTLGLYQGEKITASAIDAYYRALNGLLLPRLLARLETQMSGNLDKPDFLYEALKVYLVLGRQGPIDHDQVIAWLYRDFTTTMPGDDDAPVRDSLLAHADAMLQRPLTKVALNEPLVAQVRGILAREPVAEYSYNRIMRSPRVQALPEWSIADTAGPNAAKVFTLRSGKPVTSGMPGIFTWAGYHDTFWALLPTVTQDIAENQWVLGREGKGGLLGQIGDVNRLRRDVIGLYLDEYQRRWDRLIADIAIRTTTDVNEVADQLAVISAPESPLRNLLTGIDAQTQLSRKGSTDAATAQLEAKAGKAAKGAAGLGKMIGQSGLSVNQNAVVNILGETFGGAPGETPVDPATRVDQHFKWLHDFVTPGQNGPPPMEGVLQKIGAVSTGLNQVTSSANQNQAFLAQASGTGGAVGAAGAAAQLAASSRDVPPPIAVMLQSVAQTSSAAVTAGAAQGLAAAWKNTVLPKCDAALFNRYPFSPTSNLDVPTDDFVQLLGPGGLIEQFFNQYLKPLVDTTTKPWKWQAANHQQFNFQQTTLSQFEAAASIRDSLFRGQPQISIPFTLTPTTLDSGVGQITLDIGGQSLTYNHGPAESMHFQWPGQGNKTLSRVTMTPISGAATNLEQNGPWALLRLLEGKLQPAGAPDIFTLTFASPGGNAAFRLNADSVQNPFTLPALRTFRCPATL